MKFKMTLPDALTAGDYNVEITPVEVTPPEPPTPPDTNPDPEAYGTAAYRGTNPIGGGSGFVSSYKESDAKYHAETLADLSKVLDEIKGDQILWLAKDITIPTNFGKTLPERSVFASDGKTLLWTYKSTGFMRPVIYRASHSVVSGVNFKGPGGACSTSGPNEGNCAMRGLSAAVATVTENCNISECACGGIYFYGGDIAWDSPNRHIVRNTTIHNCQRHGFGYGICEEGNAAFLADACIFYDDRHHVMAQGSRISSFGNSYELIYCVFGDARYTYLGDPNNLYYNHQVDCHGGESISGSRAGNTLKIHWCDFTTNDSKPNVCIRGVPKNICEITKCRTVKLHDGKAGVYSLTKGDSAFQMWAGATGDLADYNVKAWDNQYGWVR